MAIVRPETEADIVAVRPVIQAAYGRDAEAYLVDELRHTNGVVLSLVALRCGKIVGHAFFSRVVVTRGVGYDLGVGLAPVAVLPEHQRSGVGTDLIRYGIAALKGRCHGILVAEGKPAFYRRFGFQPAERFGLKSSLPCPPDHFMAMPLDDFWLGGHGGVVRYAPAFEHLQA